jgi:alpha-D-glucose phosphate-specific phosphoglucomutase
LKRVAGFKPAIPLDLSSGSNGNWDKGAIANMTSTIKFGTDGWRAVIAEDFTFDNVRACAQGFADYLKEKNLNGKGIVIGNDTRFASDEFAAASAEVMAANGIKTWLCTKPTPTPVVSYSIVATRSGGGIVITASHNPGSYNGFKVKDDTGASAPTELVDQVEKYTNKALSTGNIKRIPLDEGIKSGKIAWYEAMPPYVAHINNLIDLEPIRNAKFHVAVDSMYGAGIGWFKNMLGGGNLDFTEIHGERNPLFPGLQPEPIAKHLTGLRDLIKENKADVGLATDGDADRIGIMTEKGDFLNQLEVFSLFVLYLIEVRGERRPIVRSICSSDMIDMLGKKYNIPVYLTKVGFKYVAPVMKEKDASIGGEESGGYGFRGNVPERDGGLAGIYFLDYMIKTGKTPSQLLEHLFDIVGPHYYDRYDFHVDLEKHHKIVQNMESKVVDTVAGIKVKNVDRLDGYKFFLADDSWLLIRFSGTEPLIRIYSESHSPDEVKKILDNGVKIVGL